MRNKNTAKDSESTKTDGRSVIFNAYIKLTRKVVAMFMSLDFDYMGIAILGSLIMDFKKK